MRNGSFMRSRKFRYGSIAVTMTALVVALIIMLNAGISALADKYGFYIDMTNKGMYSLTDNCRDLLDENIKQTIADRKAANEALPATNLEVAQTNVERMTSSLALADTNIDRADKNIALTERNRVLLSKSASLAEDNLEIAQDNLALAQELYEYVLEKEGKDAENTAAADSTVKLAQENLKIAEENIETAAKNRSAASGYTPLAVFAELPVLGGYKYFGAYTPQINDDDTATAAENKQIAERNKAVAAENLAIANENRTIAETNKTAGAVPGGAGYTAPWEYKPYEAFLDFTTYTRIGSSETPRAFESYLETETEKQLQSEVGVKIIFCDDRDALYENTAQRYVLETAEDIQRAFPDIIGLEFVNVWTNPDAVRKYKGTSLSNIYSTNVIIESGTEFRVYSLNRFFVFNDAENTDPWSYNGEKIFASGILAVIKAESPVACVTINHGEAFTDYELLYLLEDAGYIVQSINLATQELPADCRLVVVCNPTSDFLIKDSVSDISEIAKLNTWLDDFNSLLVFMSPDSPVLPNFEEYLEEWGVSFDRHTAENGTTFPYMIKDTTQSLTADGMTVVGEYTTKGLGASIHTDMRSVSFPAKVIFKNAMSISYADNYKDTTYEDEDDATKNYRYGYYYSNGVSRSIYDVFTTSANAVALANGEQVAAASTLDPFKLMTITRETQMVSNDDADYSHVIACGSTEFVSADMLQSIVYGNSDVLISALRAVGKETIVVDLAHKPFDKTEIESLTTAQANQYTVILAAVPTLIVMVLGIFVVVRRKYA